MSRDASLLALMRSDGFSASRADHGRRERHSGGLRRESRVQDVMRLPPSNSSAAARPDEKPEARASSAPAIVCPPAFRQSNSLSVAPGTLVAMKRRFLAQARAARSRALGAALGVEVRLVDLLRG